MFLIFAFLLCAVVRGFFHANPRGKLLAWLASGQCEGFEVFCPNAEFIERSGLS